MLPAFLSGWRRQATAAAAGAAADRPSATAGSGPGHVLPKPRSLGPLRLTPSLSVLVADDEKGIRDMLSLALPALGHRVVGTAGDGAEAVALARSLRPDLLIIDVRMPGLDGLTAAKQILALRPLPIIFTTGLCDAETSRNVVDLDAAACLLKPFETAQLFSTVELALARHRQKRQRLRAA